MKKLMLPLQIIAIIGMFISMIIVFTANTNEGIIYSLVSFIWFGYLGAALIFVEEKLKKLTN
jgi:hypothetical protein